MKVIHKNLGGLLIVARHVYLECTEAYTLHIIRDEFSEYNIELVDLVKITGVVFLIEYGLTSATTHYRLYGRRWCRRSCVFDQWEIQELHL